MPNTHLETISPIAGSERSFHQFRLILSGNPEPLEEKADKLFEAGCDDALFGTSAGVPTISFAREAPSMSSAIMSAMADLRRAGVGLAVVRIEPELDTTENENEAIRKLNNVLDLQLLRTPIHEIEDLWPKLGSPTRLGTLDPSFPGFPPDEREILRKIALEGKNFKETAIELGLSWTDFTDKTERALYRLYTEPHYRASLQRFRLSEVPEPDIGGRPTIARDKNGPAVLLIGPELRYFYECARCGVPLMIGLDVMGTLRIQNIVLRCNQCGALNEFPD
jgi:hypothetical protein